MQAVLYTRENCIECDRAKALLYHLNITHLEYKLGEHYNQKQFYDEFGQNACQPQIAIDYKHIGGMKEFLKYLKDREMI